MSADPRTPSIAVVGRQNVGKSTLVNRLFGRRQAIAHDLPGVTRDRIEIEATWRGRRFGLVDTAGYLRGASGLEALAARQAALATTQADLVVLVVDARTGATDEDAELARRLHKGRVPVLLVANKADSPSDAADVASFYTLGLGEPLGVSALHGNGTGELLDRIVDLLPDAPPESEDLDEPRFAIVGRPNVGKSSLFNRLIGEERSVVSEVPGTTRDSVDSFVTWPGYGRVRFVDTAGMRHGGRVRSVEYYSFLRASDAIDRAHVAVLVIDASDGFTGEDKRIASRVMEAGRGLFLVGNKWDLVEEKDRTYKDLVATMRPFANAAIIRASATRGQGVHRLPPLLMDLHERWTVRATTARVNEILHAAQGERPTPRSAGTLHYATQISTGPPTIVVFGGAKPPDPGYRRFLENRFRREFELDGIPIRLRFRSRQRNQGPRRPDGR